MTTKELIEILQLLRQDAPVCIAYTDDDNELDYSEIIGAELCLDNSMYTAKSGGSRDIIADNGIVIVY